MARVAGLVGPLQRRALTLAREARHLRRQRRRAERAQKTAARGQVSNFLPPEGVPLRFQVAGVGMRFTAQMADVLITGCFVLAVVLLIALSGLANWSAVVTAGALLFLFIRAPYYIATELLWNGQTLGKRLTGIRTISADGRSLSPYAVTVRNLMKEIEIFYPGMMMLAAESLDPEAYLILLIWLAVILAVPLLNARRQRLGDIIAGTYVVYQPKAILMPDLAGQRSGPETAQFTFLRHHLDHYGAFELQTLEKILHAPSAAQGSQAERRQSRNIADIAGRIVAKIDYSETVPDARARDFLQAFYTAQRQYLESRKLMGDARADKFHDENSETGQNPS